MTHEDFLSLLVRAFTEITGVDFYRSDDSFDIPAAPIQYGTLGMLLEDSLAPASRSHKRADPLGPNGEEVIETVREWVELTISVNIYRGINTSDLLRKLKSSLRSDAAITQYYEGVALGYQGAVGPRNLWESISGTRVPRSQMDLTFNTSFYEEFYVEEIREVNIDVSVGEVDSTINVIKP